eukprot:scaffold26397_cov44-Prasinocladus_malaysianus.AAC.1
MEDFRIAASKAVEAADAKLRFYGMCSRQLSKRPWPRSLLGNNFCVCRIFQRHASRLGLYVV